MEVPPEFKATFIKCIFYLSLIKNERQISTNDDFKWWKWHICDIETQKSAVFFSSRPQLLLNQPFGFSFRSAGKVNLQSIESGHKASKHWLHPSWRPSLCRPLSPHPNPHVRQERCTLLVSAQAKQQAERKQDGRLQSRLLCSYSNWILCHLTSVQSEDDSECSASFMRHTLSVRVCLEVCVHFCIVPNILNVMSDCIQDRPPLPPTN